MQVGREGRATVKAQANALIPGGLVASGIMLKGRGTAETAGEPAKGNEDL